MGNSQYKAAVYPEIEDTATWVMVTYTPGNEYPNFSYYENFSVYSNNKSKMSLLAVEPEQPKSFVQYNISWTDANDKIIQDVRFDTETLVKDLVDTLLQKVKPDNNESDNEELSDADKVRILFYWLTAQDVKNTQYGLTSDFETVSYQLLKLQNKENTYAAFFAYLCSFCNIPCVIIKGRVKGGQYDVDLPLTDNMIREWNAVLVDREWQLVDSLWGRLYHGHTLTRDGWYLFPDPTKLIYTHFPEVSKWQLIPKPITEDEFVRQPILKRRFFEMNMEILSHTKCNIRCDTGETEITFLLNAKDKDNQEFLCVTSKQTSDKKWTPEILPEENLQLDFIQKTRSSEHDEDNDLLDDKREEGDDSEIVTVLSVKVRYPTTGFYKLEIVGRNSEAEHLDWVAIYAVNVKWVPDWIVFFPRMKDIGWGPNKYLTQCGLKAISHLSGEIKCFKETQLDVKFQIRPDARTNNVKVSYTMKNIGSNEVDGTDQVDDQDVTIFTPETDRNIITVPVCVETIGEYELSISATLNATDKGHVIHYRIICVEDQTRILEEAVSEVLKALETATVSQNISALQKAIHLATIKRVQFHSRVKQKFKEACKLLNILKRYQEALKRIRNIDNKRIAILKTYTSPDAAVVTVMRAVFVVLGKPENELKTWGNIKHLLVGFGPESLTRKIQQLDINTLSRSIINNAKRVLGGMNVFDAIQKTEDVAVFAYWLEHVIKTHSATITESLDF